MSRMIERHRQRKAEQNSPRRAAVKPEVLQPARVAGNKSAGAFKGRFVTLVQTPKNTLELIPDAPAIAEFVADNVDHLPTDILSRLHTPEADAELAEQGNGGRRYDTWGDEKTLHVLLESLLASGWKWVDPKEINQLTNGTILEAPDGRLYHHERYKVESAAEELLTGKKVIFDGAPENKAPIEKQFPRAAAAPKQAADPLPPAAAPTPVSGGNPYQDWKSENLIETIESLTDSDTFAQDKPEQKAVEQMAEVLSARPVEPEPAMETKKAATLHKAAKWLGKVGTIEHRPGHKDSKGNEAPWCNVKDGKVLDSHASKEEAEKALRAHEYFKGAAAGGVPPVNSETGAILEGDKSIPDGRDKVEDHTGIVRPKTDLPDKFAAGAPPQDQETGDVLEGDKSVPDGKSEEEDHTGVDKPSTDTPSKFAAGAPPTDGETAKILEGDKSIPDSNDDVDDNTGITRPATELPSKFAAEITVAKAIKLVEDLIEDLRTLYIDAKPITKVNDTRPVREGVESIYHAMQALGETQKVLVKQQKAEEDEAAAQAVNKSRGVKATIANLVLAAAEPDQVVSHLGTVKEREAFRRSVVARATTSIFVDTASECSDAIMRNSARYARLVRAGGDADQIAGLENKIAALASQMGLNCAFRAAASGIKLVAVSTGTNDEWIDVPTA